MWQSNVFWGAIIALVGLIFLLNNLGYIDYSLGYIISRWWPVIIIIVGLDMIIRQSRKKAKS